MRPLNASTSGFVALITTILIAAILLIVTVSQGAAGLSARQNVLLAEYKARSASLANACVEWVRMRLYYDTQYPAQYTLPEVVDVGDKTCTVVYCTGHGTSARVCGVEGEYHHVYTDLVVTVADPTEPTITTFKEVGTL